MSDQPKQESKTITPDMECRKVNHDDGWRKVNFSVGHSTDEYPHLEFRKKGSK